jgi:hypothetical protein
MGACTRLATPRLVEELCASARRDAAKEHVEAARSARSLECEQHGRARCVELAQMPAFEDDISGELFEMLGEKGGVVADERTYERGMRHALIERKDGDRAGHRVLRSLMTLAQKERGAEVWSSLTRGETRGRSIVRVARVVNW